MTGAAHPSSPLAKATQDTARLSAGSAQNNPTHDPPVLLGLAVQGLERVRYYPRGVRAWRCCQTATQTPSILFAHQSAGDRRPQGSACRLAFYLAEACVCLHTIPDPALTLAKASLAEAIEACGGTGGQKCYRHHHWPNGVLKRLICSSVEELSYGKGKSSWSLVTRG